MIVMILVTIFALFVLYLHFRFSKKFKDVLSGIPEGEYPCLTYIISDLDLWS